MTRVNLSKHIKVAKNSQARVSNATALTHNAHNHCYTARHNWKWIDIESSTPSSISQRCKLRSNIYWLTEFCNSQCISHFAAFFIINWAKTFIAKTYYTSKVQARHMQVAKEFIIKHTAARRLQKQPMPPTSKWWKTHSMGTPPQLTKSWKINVVRIVQMILPQVHLQKPCYDFSFL